MKKGIFTFFMIMLVSMVSAQQEKPCMAAECRQFDFWLGEWDLTWIDKNGNEQKGHNSITSILDGCVVQERFDGNPGMDFKGMSLSVYNKHSGKWQQTWVDNAGGYMVFTGEFSAGAMVLAREIERNGQKIVQRMHFYDITSDSLKWDWEISKDNGESWQLNWRIFYRRAM